MASDESQSNCEGTGADRASASQYNDVNCTIELRRYPQGAGSQRYVSINGFTVHIAGRDDERGIYRAYLSWDGNERQYEDFMHTSIRRFVDAVRGCGEALCDGEEGYCNLKCQLDILRAVFTNALAC
ncbi:MAG TPA: hypothetical protein EYP10_07205 [Armatimonadetes bacterium]|nr:hypothetical protein [Armatimonadota bacterium]